MHLRDDERENQFVGCLLGTAVGDSIGLAAERLSADQIARRWPKPLRQSLFFGYGCISDDTEHAYLTARCLALHGQDVSRFRRALASRLRWWFVALPALPGGMFSSGSAGFSLHVFSMQAEACAPGTTRLLHPIHPSYIRAFLLGGIG